MSKKNNFAVVAYTNFSRDSRVQKEAFAAIDSGYLLDIYSLNNKNPKNNSSLNFFKCNIDQYKGSLKIKYVFSYIHFFIHCFFSLTFNYFFKNYKYIHFHNMPNFIVFSGIIPKILGAKIILDIHDLMPELFSVKFGMKKSHPLIKILYFEERISAKFADEIIATNSFHIRRFKENGFGYKRITQVINIADEKIFYPPDRIYSADEELVLAYPSTLSKRLGIDDLIDAIEILHNKRIPLKLLIYGDGEYRSDIVKIIKEKNLQDVIILSNSFVPLEKLSIELDKAHVGIIPLPSNDSNDIAMPVKIYEFFAKKICVIASDLPLLKNCFSDSVLFFEAGNKDDLACKIEQLHNNRKLLIDFAERGYKKFLGENWNHNKGKYQKIIT